MNFCQICIILSEIPSLGYEKYLPDIHFNKICYLYPFQDSLPLTLEDR